MSRIVIEKGVCPVCNKVSDFRIVQSINVPLNPELREQLVRGEINKATCSHCGEVSMIGMEVLYHDMDRGYSIVFGPNGVSEETKKSWPNKDHLVPYFKYAFFADSLEEALMYILYCENDEHQVPQSIEERDAIQDKIKEAVEISRAANARIDFVGALLNEPQ